MGFMLHPAPCLGWAGIGVDLQVRFLGALCAPIAGKPVPTGTAQVL